MRRCTDNKCLIRASDKSKVISLDLPIANILSNPKRDWKSIKGNIKVAHDLKSQFDWDKIDIDGYLFTHSTIVASVKTTDNGYYIEPPCDELVNSNGNAWTNEVLLSTFRSFVGSDNFIEHVQVPELSKGKIFDAVLRPVKYKGKSGKEADVYFCDILIGTDRKHTDLVSKIASGELSTLSMGCLANYVQCSRCGKEIKDDEDTCIHLKNEIGQYFTDENGIKRITAELCGRTIKNSNGERVGDSESMKFIEASWVERPAFTGAVLNHFISDIGVEKVANVIEMPNKDIYNLYSDLSKVRVADKDGRVVLNITRDEIKKQLEENIVDRVANWANKKVSGRVRKIESIVRIRPNVDIDEKKMAKLVANKLKIKSSPVLSGYGGNPIIEFFSPISGIERIMVEIVPPYYDIKNGVTTNIIVFPENHDLRDLRENAKDMDVERSVIKAVNKIKKNINMFSKQKKVSGRVPKVVKTNWASLHNDGEVFEVTFNSGDTILVLIPILERNVSISPNGRRFYPARYLNVPREIDTWREPLVDAYAEGDYAKTRKVEKEYEKKIDKWLKSVAVELSVELADI